MAAVVTGHESAWRDAVTMMLFGEMLLAWGGTMLQAPLEARRAQDVALLRGVVGIAYVVFSIGLVIALLRASIYGLVYAGALATNLRDAWSRSAAVREYVAARSAASFGLLIVIGVPLLFLGGGEAVTLIGIAYFALFPVVDTLLERRLVRPAP